MKIRFLIFAFVPLIACQPSADNSEKTALEIDKLCTKCAQPNLTVHGDSLYLSYISRQENKSTLKLSVYDGNSWTAPEIIAEGDNWFVNWADFPSVFINEDRLHTYFLQKSGEGSYFYDIMYTSRSISGGSWSTPVKLHNDSIQAEHGFVDFYQAPAGNTGVVWLDGRFTGGEAHGDGGAMTLATAWIDSNGNITGEKILDNRICDCCQSSAVRTNSGVLVVYRDRDQDETRDISMVRYDGEQWSEPVDFSEDHWQINACPVNGPAVDAGEYHVMVAWYTGAGDSPTVNARISRDGGITFGEKFQVNDSTTAGRIDVLALPGDLFAVSYLEKFEETEVRVKLFDRHGKELKAYNAGKISPSRSSGFPRMATFMDSLFIVWTDVKDETIRMEVLPPLTD